MNASYEWLRAFVPVNAAPRQLADLITAHTATVDELFPLRTDLAPIVIARVVEAGKHPDSDHLWLTKVDDGKEMLEVVCGAPNVTAGALYPFARVGVTMPNGMKIERRKIRGVVSNGMLCSARELGLGENHDGILELDVEAAPGTSFLAAMPVGDTRLVIDVGANRADLHSHLGLARELAAITKKKWSLPAIPNLPTKIAAPKRARGKGTTAGVEVHVDSDTKTRRYLAAVVRGATVGPSPEWLVRRLDAVGSRSINNVVDATNYVLHELGQPVHAFDLSKMPGVVVRKSRAGERLLTLDGVARELPVGAVVIADATGRPQAVAGVMGGKDSEVGTDTRDILVEVACFDPKATRATRRALGLSTDASYRFERGVDPEVGPQAMDRVLKIILSLAGGTLAAPPVDVAATAKKAPEITLRLPRARQLLGVDITPKVAKAHLVAAGFEVRGQGARQMKVGVPSWRMDVVGEADLIEEIARFHGYDRFPDEIRPYRPTTTADDPMWTTAGRIREMLVGLGLLEVRPMPFVRGDDGTHARVANPLSEDEAYLRTSILETLSRRAEHNLAQRTGDVRIFEIGSVFQRRATAMPVERATAGALIMGRARPPHFSEPEPPMLDEWDAKAVAERMVRAAFPSSAVELRSASAPKLWDVVVDGSARGSVTRVALDAPVWAGPAFAVEIDLGEMETAPPAPRGKHHYMEGAPRQAVARTQFRQLPTMPPAEFDLALLVPSGTSAADVERAIRESAGELLEQLTLFDQYVGAGVPAGHRSLAWRLTFRHPERTLRDKEIDGRRAAIIRALEDGLNVRQRTA